MGENSASALQTLDRLRAQLASIPLGAWPEDMQGVISMFGQAASVMHSLGQFQLSEEATIAVADLKVYERRLLECYEPQGEYMLALVPAFLRYLQRSF